MWSATLTTRCRGYSTTPFSRGFNFTALKVRGGKENELSFFFGCSPSICHSDSDLSEGSRKYSPSSETSLETQRACGKARACRTHSHASKKKRVEHPLESCLPQKWKIIHLDKQLSRPLPLFYLCHCRRKQLLSYMCSLSFFFFVSCFVSSSRLHLSGGFSETYSALCDYNGISCKEEVQWVRALGLCHCECF